jgi:predicted ArsR family transcriptional regulator
MAGETRNRILDYFSKNYSASAADLSNTLGLTKPDIQYHFKILLKEGVIEKLTPEPGDQARRGRPTIHYRLTKDYYLNNLHPLLNAVLNVGLSSLESPHAKEEFYMKVAYELVGTHKAAGSLAQSLSQALYYLNRLNYQAHWEAHHDGPKIIFRNCPYVTLIDKYPELCLMDVSILEHILDASVNKTRHIQDEDFVPPSCIFRMMDM